jgi:hypothetical protein
MAYKGLQKIMTKSVTISTILTLLINFSVRQTKQSIDCLLLSLNDIKNSKNLSKKASKKNN